MIDFSKKTYENILEDGVYRIPEMLDKRETSIVKVSLMSSSKEFEICYAAISSVQAGNNPLLAQGIDLDNIALMRGIFRKEATFAQRILKFNIPVKAGMRFSTIDLSNSVVYKTNVEAKLNEETGMYEALATCETEGTIGNLYIGNLLPIVNIEGLTTAIAGNVEIPGTDEETDDSLRTRYFNSLNRESFAGNIASYQEYALGISGVGAVQVYPTWQGAGTVKLSILDGNYEPASPTLIELVQNTICPPEDGTNVPSDKGFGMAPIDAVVTVGTATELPLDITFNAKLVQGSSVASIQARVETSINEFLLEVRKTFGDKIKTNKVIYPINVYISRLTAKILEDVSEILNITNFAINGNEEDVECVETAQLQEIPTLNSVIITQVG